MHEPAAANDGESGDRALVVLEADLDRLLFRIMGLGDMEEVEQALRRARRLVSRAIRA